MNHRPAMHNKQRGPIHFAGHVDKTTRAA